MRHFGIMSGRQSLGGASELPATTQDNYASRVSELSDDRELSALIFAGLCASPLIVFSIILFYLAS